jgi:hypothetical protein
MLKFPGLTEDGDDLVHVVIRNPRMVPAPELIPPELAPLDGESETARTLRAANHVISRLVRAWHVYDAYDESDDAKPLDLPATPELVGKLPVEIYAKISEELAEVRNPG